MCPDTYAASYVQQSTSEAGMVANVAGARKKAKYASLSRTHFFFPSQLTPQGHLVRRPWPSLISVAIQ